MSDKRVKFRSIILSALNKGELKIGSKLPTEIELTQQYGISRTTVREGIATLVQEGILSRRKRAGTFVSRLRSMSRTRVVSAIISCVRGRSDSVNDMLRTIEDRTHEENYSLVLCNHDNDPERMRRYVERAAEDESSGVLLSALEGPNREELNLRIIRQLERHRIPFVLLGSPISAQTLGRYSIATSDGFTATREMVRHLVALGHRQIAYIPFPGSYNSDNRLAGFREEMHAQGLAVPEDYVQPLLPIPVEQQGPREVRALLQLSPAPTAVICVHDLLARNVIETVRTLGLRIPDDLAVVGFGDMPFTPVMDPPLTTVRTPIQEEGAAIARMLFEKISGQFVGERQVFFPCRLIIRRSCGTGAPQRTP
jgi:DNA-binding LacI/PurR family transcriptional regulator